MSFALVKNDYASRQSIKKPGTLAVDPEKKAVRQIEKESPEKKQTRKKVATSEFVDLTYPVTNTGQAKKSLKNQNIKAFHSANTKNVPVTPQGVIAFLMEAVLESAKFVLDAEKKLNQVILDSSNKNIDQQIDERNKKMHEAEEKKKHAEESKGACNIVEDVVLAVVDVVATVATGGAAAFAVGGITAALIAAKTGLDIDGTVKAANGDLEGAEKDFGISSNLGIAITVMLIVLGGISAYSDTIESMLEKGLARNVAEEFEGRPANIELANWENVANAQEGEIVDPLEGEQNINVQEGEGANQANQAGNGQDLNIEEQQEDIALQERDRAAEFMENAGMIYTGTDVWSSGSTMLYKEMMNDAEKVLSFLRTFMQFLEQMGKSLETQRDENNNAMSDDVRTANGNIKGLMEKMQQLLQTNSSLARNI